MGVYYRNFAITNRDATPQLKKMDLDKFPIVWAGRQKQDALIKLVKKIINLNSTLNETTENSDEFRVLQAEIEKVDQQIDQAVYKLYNLTQEEIKIVERNLR